MAESYDIHLTDPLSTAFKIKAFTSNGNIFPTSSSTLNVSTNSSLLIHGKGQPNYGERMAENILHVLENFSGSTQPLHPISGQLWYARHTIIRTGADFWIWSDATETWSALTVGISNPNPPLVADTNNGVYNLRLTDLFIAVTDTSHPLSIAWVSRLFEDRTGTDPNADGLLPRKTLKIYNGSSWKNANSIAVSDVVPANSDIGDLLYDTTDSQLKIHNGTSFVSASDRYLLLDGTSAMTGALDMGTNLISNVTDPVGLQDVATKNYVDMIVSGTPTNLNGLTDVTITAPANLEVLKYNGAVWVNELVDVSDLGITASLAQVNYLNTASGNIQSQLNNLQTGKLDKSGGTMTGAITLPGAPTNALHAATRQYVLDNAIIELSDLSDIDTSGVLLDQLLQFDGVSWVPSNYVHTHTSDEVLHSTNKAMLRDAQPIDFPVIPLDNVIEGILANIEPRLDNLDSFANREVFVATAAQTDFIFTDGRYKVGSNRLSVYVDGVKQYADERARQRINFVPGRNLSPSSSLELVSAGVYDLDVTVDGGATTVVVFNLDSTSTIGTIIDQLNASFTPSAPFARAAWDRAETAIYIFSATSGNGSEMDIVEGSGAGLAVDGGLIAMLSTFAGVVAPAYVGITPTNPSNVTNITADLNYKESLLVSGYQEVDIGGAVSEGDLTGLTNDATVYTATIAVDGGGAQPIAVTGSAAQDYTSLMIEINADLSGAIVTLIGGNLVVTSLTGGAASTIAIVNTDLFSTLTTWVGLNAAVPGVTLNDTTFGQESTMIRFNAGLTGSEIVELISSATSELIS